MKRLTTVIAACLLSSAVHANQVLTAADQEALEVVVACAATNAILATQMEPPLQAIVQSEAERFRDFIADDYQYIIGMAIEELGAAYNAGTVRWDDMVRFAQHCSTFHD